MINLIQKIKCLFGIHDLMIDETKIVRGLLFGKPTEVHKWRCKRCGKIDNNWTITETLI